MIELEWATSPAAKLQIKGTDATLNVGNSTAYLFVNSSSGNVGIGTTAPLMNLEVSGGVMLNTTNQKPSCSDSIRGTIWFEKSNQYNDKLYACMRNSTGHYNWILVAIGGFGT